MFNSIKLLAKKHLEIDTNNTDRAIAHKFLSGKKLYVYMDDLDRGWSGDKDDIRRLSALLNSLRDICGDFREIQFRIGLRSDVFHLIRTSDESTDKIEQYIVNLTWTNHDILVCMAKRVATYFGEDISGIDLEKSNQLDIAKQFQRVIVSRFDGAGKWENAPIHRVLLSLTRRRPRDLVKMFSGAATEAYANHHLVISSEDLRKTFKGYSQDRLQDIINEFKSEMPNIEALLLGMRPTAKHRQGDHPFLYKNDELSKKLTNIMSSSSIRFANGQIADFHNIKQFLYKIGFIIARNDKSPPEWVFFEENRFAGSKDADFGYSWEVHPAYRWALERQSVNEIINGIDLHA